MIPWPKFGRSSAGPGWGSTSRAGLPTAAGGASQKRTSGPTYVGFDAVALVEEARIEGVKEIDVLKFRKE